MAEPDDEVQAFFDSLSKKVAGKLSGVIRSEAEGLSAKQKARLQSLEQSPDETGHLEESCVAVPGRNDLEYYVQAGGDLTTKAVRAGSDINYDYAEAFELGTVKQPARSFFWSTYRENAEEIHQNIEDAVNDAISNS